MESLKLRQLQKILLQKNCNVPASKAWTLFVVVGKYRVVEDLKDSNENEKKYHVYFFKTKQ